MLYPLSRDFSLRVRLPQFDFFLPTSGVINPLIHLKTFRAKATVALRLFYFIDSILDVGSNSLQRMGSGPRVG